jgi:restriction system protein
MAIPKQPEIELPLLEVLVALGGRGKPRQIYPLVTQKFTQLTKEDLEEVVSGRTNKWTNRIQWSRQALVSKGEIESPERGIWAITEKGKQRLRVQEVSPPIVSSKVNLVEIYDEYEEGFKSLLLDKLSELTPRQFEEFAKRFLQAYGFLDVDVTKVGPDGGIDGFGRLKIGLASMNVAFQCKKWSGNIGSKEIQQFRGAIQGKYEQGIFFTTSDFTQQAKDISFQQGAVPIVLINGEGIVEIMLDKGFGIKKKPLYLYFDNLSDFMELPE